MKHIFRAVAILPIAFLTAFLFDISGWEFWAMLAAFIWFDVLSEFARSKQ